MGRAARIPVLVGPSAKEISASRVEPSESAEQTDPVQACRIKGASRGAAQVKLEQIPVDFTHSLRA